jgi:predicted RNase H-like HicB family nuclease
MAAEEYFTPEEIAEARRYRMVIQWSDIDRVFLVSLPELDGVTAHADTAAAAAERGIELACEWIDAYRQLGRAIPPPISALEPVASRAA